MTILFDAIKNNVTIEEFQGLLSANPSLIDTPGIFQTQKLYTAKCTPLSLAVRMNRADIAKCLIEWKANIYDQSSDCYSLKFVSSPEMLDVFKNAQIDINATVDAENLRFRQTLLSRVVQTCVENPQDRHWLDLIYHLLNSGADVTKGTLVTDRFSGGWWDKSVIENLLLSYNKSKAKDANYHENAKHLATLLLKHQPQMPEGLLYVRTPAGKKAYDNNPLWCEIRDELEMAKMLQSLEASPVNVSETDKEGCTALHHAAKEGNTLLVKALVQLGANINALCNVDDEIPSYEQEHYTPLHQAAENGHLATVRTLFDLGARNYREMAGTLLHWACEKGYEKLVHAILVESKNSLENQNELYFTPLHLAAMYGHNDVIKVLLEFGANKEERLSDYFGSQGTGETPLLLAAYKGHSACVVTLLEAGADYTATNTFGNTALHLAAVDGNQSIVQALLEKGADLDEKNQNHQTAFDIAKGRAKTYLETVSKRKVAAKA